ncbi:MAG: N-formylglutamate amidohydrolase [Deltaproteobacteria bacterium]|nr:N-formylglutamate amidohydrolase [Deltaproteobacteria bacterium]
MAVAPFELIEPRTGEVPVVVEVPHAGLWIDPESMAHTLAPVRAIGRDADLYVDELAVEAPDRGASLLMSRISRYVVDLNREPTDYDRGSVDSGSGSNFPRGVIWRLTAEGEPVLHSPVSESELERRLDRYYRPYHQALERVVRRKTTRFGGAVVVSLHSMPSMGKAPGSGLMTARADVVIGTRGQTTASRALISLVDDHVRTFGWSVAHDDPYRGGATTTRLGQPDQGVHAIQIELARRLYMDETSLTPKAGAFGVVQSFCGGLVARIGAAALG